MLSFGLERHVEHPRVMEAANPYPDRWTHHVLLGGPEEVDGLVKIWLEEAYFFAKTKKRRK